MKYKIHTIMISAFMVAGCSNINTQQGSQQTSDFEYSNERFADLQMLRYRVDGFEDLTLKQKTFIYYLQEAALYGRDILFDQNGKYILRIRKMLEDVYVGYQGDKTAQHRDSIRHTKRTCVTLSGSVHYSTYSNHLL